MTFDLSGLILLKKPVNVTSFYSLNSVKKSLSTGKVGHTGTLDKFAEGLMLVLTGKMTKLAPYFSGLDKEYRAVFEFGKETATLDPEGDLISEADIPSLPEIEEAVSHFTGDIMQVPPDFSAVHVNGRRAYRIAATGAKPELKERPVRIDLIEIEKWEPPFLHVKVACSKGTYIRSLARDLGIKAGSRAYVTRLERTKVGSWTVDNAVLPEDFDPAEHLITGIQLFRSIPGINIYYVDSSQEELIRKSYAVRNWDSAENPLPEGISAVFNHGDTFLALVSKTNSGPKYVFVGVSSS